MSRRYSQTGFAWLSLVWPFECALTVVEAVEEPRITTEASVAAELLNNLVLADATTLNKQASILRPWLTYISGLQTATVSQPTRIAASDLHGPLQHTVPLKHVVLEGALRFKRIEKPGLGCLRTTCSILQSLYRHTPKSSVQQSMPSPCIISSCRVAAAWSRYVYMGQVILTWNWPM